MSIDLRLTDEQSRRLDDCRLSDPALLPGLVVREHREAHLLLLPDGSERLSRPGGRLRHEAAAPADLPAVGDRVAAVVPAGGGDAVVRAVLPRRTALLRKRPDRSVAAQVLAANVDTVLLTASLARPFSARRLERALALAWDGGADPVVLLTKSALHPHPEGAAREAAVACPGAPAVAVSAVTGAGIDALAPWLLPGRTVVLLGPSGEGKSTLANRLLGADLLETGGVRAVDGRGRHTTVDRHLVELPGGAFLVDTPGLREIALFDAAEGIASAFADIEEAALRCRFRDCGHDGEPGCAVEGAVAAGTLDGGRLESWRRLRREEAFLERKAGIAALWEAKRRRRAHGRMVEDALEWKRRLRGGGE